MSNGKGDSPRNCFTEKYRNNYDEIFRKANRHLANSNNIGLDSDTLPLDKKQKINNENKRNNTDGVGQRVC